MKYKMILEFEGTPSKNLHHNIKSIQELKNISIQDENEKEIHPYYDHEFQDLIDELNTVHVRRCQIEKYGSKD